MLRRIRRTGPILMLVVAMLTGLALSAPLANAQDAPPPKPPPSETAPVPLPPSALAPSDQSCATVKARLQATPQEKRPAQTTCFEITEKAQGGSGGISPRAIVPTTATCDAAYQSGGTSFATTRRDSCKIWGLYINRLNSSGVQNGRVTVDIREYAYLGDTNVWGHQLELIPVSFTAGMQGTTLGGFASCGGACTTQAGSNFPVQTLVQGQRINAESYHRPTNTAAGSLGNSTSRWTYTAVVPNTVNGPINSAAPATPNIRCDVAAVPGVSSTGCVFSAFVPAIIYSRTGSVPELANHIGDAQASGLPGAYPNGTPLTRLINRDDALDNRRTACPSRYTRPSGKSCDEYPFASSNQGADQVQGVGRTFSYCQIPQLGQATGPGYSACMINASQNSLGGSQLATFFRQNRVIANDAYRVWIQ